MRPPIESITAGRLNDNVRGLQNNYLDVHVLIILPVRHYENKVVSTTWGVEAHFLTIVAICCGCNETVENVRTNHWK